MALRKSTKQQAKKKVVKKIAAKKVIKKKAAKKAERDIEKAYTTKAFANKLRRLADALENGKRFQLQVAGERVSVPASATFNIEHEREGSEEEIEFQVKWINN